MTNRTKNGKFKKGHSGNPGGRPKAALDVQELAREHTTEALNTLVQIMRKGKYVERIHASRIIIERGWGRPMQASEVTTRELGPIQPVFEINVMDIPK